MTDEFDLSDLPHFTTEAVKCPHCGHERRDDLEEYEEGRNYELDCLRCDKPFKMRFYVSRTFISDKIEPKEATSLAMRETPNGEQE